MHTSRTLYFVMAGWCIVGSTIRISWFLQAGHLPDALPIVTIAIALVALAYAFRHKVPTEPPRGDDR